MARHSNLALRIAAACVLATLGSWISTSFVVGHPPAPNCRSVARRAEEGDVALEAPPSDEEISQETSLDPRPVRKFKPKREIRGTLCYARRELNEEAERLRPYIEPLLYTKRLSLKEITFVLNRMGKQLRPLLYKPRVGLPVFTEHKVRRLMRRAKNEKGIRINSYARPAHLPADAPGAPYPWPMKDVFAEVPPLGWQEMPEYAHLLRENRAKAYEEREETRMGPRYSRDGSYSRYSRYGGTG
mmetsp:Transcript_21379/g.26332  ORF Transcript_21379/g.26332 Transcript_21379/m.26332 type:complete len:243 (-) Transcript_21379:112-840(-)